MSKRGAERQLTKDDYEAEGDSGDESTEMMAPGTWNRASQDEIKSRKMFSARRKGISAASGVPAAAMPTFNFGAPSSAAYAAPVVSQSTTNNGTSTTTTTTLTSTTPATASSSSDSAAEWKCGVCDTMNKSSLAQCSMCDEPRPATAAATSTDSTATSAPATTTTTVLKETVPNESKSAEAPAASSTSITSTTTTTSSAKTAPVFGSFGTDSSTTSGFSFSSSEAGASASTFGSMPAFAGFGGAVSDSAFSFSSVLAKSDSGFGGGAPSSTVAFEPSSAESIIATEETKEEFKNREAELTGEEDDEIHLKVQTKVYQQKPVVAVQESHPPAGEVSAAAAASSSSATPAPTSAAAAASSSDADPNAAKPVMKWVEIGSGELHVNTAEDPATKKTRARMVLREDRTKRSVLNAPLFVNFAYKMESDKHVKFVSFDLENQKATFLLKFKEKSQTEEVMRTIETCIDLIKQ